MFFFVVIQAPRYLTDLCIAVSDGSIFDLLLGVHWWFGDAGSANWVHGPSVWPCPSLWNSLPDSLRDPDLDRDNLQTSAEDAFINTVLKHFEHSRYFRTICSTN